MQISYHSILTKIQKLQNLKKKKKKKNSVPTGIVRNWLVQLVFFPVRNMGVIVGGENFKPIIKCHIKV